MVIANGLEVYIVRHFDDVRYEEYDAPPGALEHIINVNEKYRGRDWRKVLHSSEGVTRFRLHGTPQGPGEIRCGKREALPSYSVKEESSAY
jgi:hypothetical protein